MTSSSSKKRNVYGHFLFPKVYFRCVIIIYAYGVVSGSEFNQSVINKQQKKYMTEEIGRVLRHEGGRGARRLVEWKKCSYLVGLRICRKRLREVDSGNKLSWNKYAVMSWKGVCWAEFRSSIVRLWDEVSLTPSDVVNGHKIKSPSGSPAEGSPSSNSSAGQHCQRQQQVSRRVAPVTKRIVKLILVYLSSCWFWSSIQSRVKWKCNRKRKEKFSHSRIIRNVTKMSEKSARARIMWRCSKKYWRLVRKVEGKEGDKK